MSAPGGVCSGGVSAPGGCLLGGVSALKDFQFDNTSSNFVAAGKNTSPVCS